MLNYRFAITFCLLACIVSCDKASLPIAPVEDGSITPADNKSQTISFVHLNDTYRVGDVEEGRKGGFGRVATVASRLKATGNNVLIMHAGDLLYPSLESQLWGGEQMIEAMNYLAGIAPIYLVPGNHEFDERNPTAIVNALRSSRFVWLADNMRLDTGLSDVDSMLHTAQVITIGDYKIGIFALTLLPRDGGNERDYAPIEGEYVETASGVIAELERQDPDIIIGLTHLFLADDRKVAALKQQHPRFLFILGGHEHEPEYESADENTAAIFKGASNARAIWQVDVDFSGAEPGLSSTLIELGIDIPVDEDYQRIADKWRERLLAKIPFLESYIGEAALPMDAREESIRNGESSWGNFIADQMPAAFGQPQADLAFINSGTLRLDDVVAEDITFEDVGRTFGFSSFLRFMTINGADFVALLEAGYRGEGPSKGYFPHFSGFRVCVDRARPDGQRIVQLQRPTDNGWRDIARDADYSLVAPDYLYRGGDGYDFSKARDVSRPASELKYLVLDAVIRAHAQGEKIGAAVDPANPRMSFANATNELCFAR